VPRYASAIAALGALCVILVCCDNPKPTEQTQSSKTAAAEDLAALYTPHGRERAREAAARYLTAQGAAIRGMNTIEVDGGNYVVTVDLGETAPMAQLAVRQFFAEDGSRYWKAAPLDATTARVYGLALTNARINDQREPEPEPPDRERF
jgi:hypothetical protein